MTELNPWLENPLRLHAEQVDVLIAGINPRRVKALDGNSYIETYDVRAWLIRIFGFAGWSLTETQPAQLLYEQEIELKSGKPGYKVGYRASMILTIHTNNGDAYYSGSSVGEAQMPDYKRGDAHDMAMKTAESGALKRAASNLGDQFGISLYNSGSTSPLIRKAWTGTHFRSLDTKEPEPELHAETHGDTEYATAAQEEGLS